jgi:hypothetical protein
MSAVLDVFQHVELSGFAHKLMDFVDTADPCFIALVLGVLTLLGSKMASGSPALISWGLRLGVAAFLLYVGYAYVSLGGLTTEQLPGVGVRAAVAAGLVVAPTWIVLPLLGFVFGRLRLALAALLGYAAYECVASGAPDIEDLSGLALRAAAASGLVLVVAWILQPVLDVLAAALPSRRPTPQPLPVTPPQPPTPPAELPAEPSSRAGRSHRQADSQRRRRARLKAELCYALHEPLLGDRFPRETFEDFLDRYLGDQNSPEDVEECGRELEILLREHAGAVQIVEPINLTELTRWLLDEQQRIQAQEMDERRRKTQLTGLNRRYTQLAEQLLEEPALEN